MKGFCPFCGETRHTSTPRFPEALIPEGRMARGEGLLIPNLFPYDVHSGVLIMTDEHVVPLGDLDEKRLYDGLSLGVDFLRRIARLDTSLPYHIMAWNYMPPSGGGLVHPHQQYFATALPGNQFMDELRAAERYWQENGRDYWSALIEEEKGQDKRFITDAGGLSWLASFVPLGLLGDIVAILPRVFSINECGDEEMRTLASGLVKLFRYFVSVGIFSFNAVWFFGPAGQKYFPSRFRIIPRTFLNLRDYAPDLNFFQSLLQEPISVVLPEEFCVKIKPFFTG